MDLELTACATHLAPPARAVRSASDISELGETLRRQDDKVRRGDPGIEEDNEFHYTIAMASQNTVVLKVLDVLTDVLRETRERSLQVEGRPQRSMAGHRRILSPIKRHDALAEERAMRRHLEEVWEIVLNKF